MTASPRRKSGGFLTVAALLPPRLLLQVRHALGAEREVLAAASWNELERLVKTRPLRAVIVDPANGGVMDSEPVVTLLTRYPSLPIIAYVTLGPATFSGIAQLSRLGLEHVILHRFDDSVERFKKIVESVGGDPLVGQVMAALRPSLIRLPVDLATAVHDMFDEPQRYLTTSDLSTSSRIPAVRMYQNIREARLASPKNLLIAARSLRAYSYLRDPGYSATDVAEKLGYLQPRILAEHMMKVFELKPARARNRLSENVAVERVVRFVSDSEGSTI